MAKTTNNEFIVQLRGKVALDSGCLKPGIRKAMWEKLEDKYLYKKYPLAQFEEYYSSFTDPELKEEAKNMYAFLGRLIDSKREHPGIVVSRIYRDNFNPIYDDLHNDNKYDNRQTYATCQFTARIIQINPHDIMDMEVISTSQTNKSILAGARRTKKRDGFPFLVIGVIPLPDENTLKDGLMTAAHGTIGYHASVAKTLEDVAVKSRVRVEVMQMPKIAGSKIICVCKFIKVV